MNGEKHRLKDELHTDDLLQLICHASTGDLSPDQRFFNDLLRFQRISERLKRPTVTRAAIRLWARGTHPKRDKAVNFLHRYLHWSRDLSDVDTWDISRVQSFNRANQLLVEWTPPSEDGDRKTKDLLGRGEPLDSNITTAFQTLMSISNRSSQSEMDGFFRGAKLNDDQDASYYLVFRYSTNHGAVVKSFVVIRKPIREFRTTFIFNEFIGGGASPKFIDHLYRESEGVILKMEKSFYFLGSNFNVPVDKKLDPEMYRTQRRDYRWKPSGLSVMACEYDDVKIGQGLFSGVCMTVADVSQPVIARIAFLHLGVRSLLGITLLDTIVKPDVISVEDIPNNISSVVNDIKKAGGLRLGLSLERIIHENSQDISLYEKISEEIINMIANQSDWEKNLTGKKSKKSSQKHGCGAIESFGEGRPRN